MEIRWFATVLVSTMGFSILVRWWLHIESGAWSSLPAVPASLGATTWQWAISRDNEHYNYIIMGAIASQITSLMIVYSVFVYSVVYSEADQRKHQSSASLAFVRGIHRGPVNSPHKWPVTRKIFSFDDFIMEDHTYCSFHGSIFHIK